MTARHFDLSNRICLITGSSQGIGLALASTMSSAEAALKDALASSMAAAAIIFLSMAGLLPDLAFGFV